MAEENNNQTDAVNWKRRILVSGFFGEIREMSGRRIMDSILTFEIFWICIENSTKFVKICQYSQKSSKIRKIFSNFT
jgi:hypothetical protein